MSVELVVPSTQSVPTNLSMVLTICGKALKTFGSDTVSAVNVLIVLQHIIVAVSKLTGLSPDEKKQLALDSIHWLINNQTNLSIEEKQTLDLLAITIFPQAIDMLSGDKCSGGCFSCFTKK